MRRLVSLAVLVTLGLRCSRTFSEVTEETV